MADRVGKGMGSDLGEPQLRDLLGGNVIEFDVVEDQLAPNQIGENQAVDNTPDQIDTVEEIGVTGAQDDPTVVENGGQEQPHQEHKRR